MALPTALCDLEIQLSHVDLDRQASLRLKTARHPSETHDRVWLRVLAYCLFYDERIAFGPGLSDPDAPDLLTTDLTGQIIHWIRVGKADTQKIQRAVDRNPKVSVLFESPARLATFIAEARDEKVRRLEVVELAAVEPALLSSLAQGEERQQRLPSPSSATTSTSTRTATASRHRSRAGALSRDATRHSAAWGLRPSRPRAPQGSMTEQTAIPRKAISASSVQSGIDSRCASQT